MSKTPAVPGLAVPAAALAAYLPRWVSSRLPLAPGYRETAEVAVLYADLRGFTALTAALAAEEDGAERLGAALDRIYTPLIAAIHDYGGDVISFAGDGLTAQFAEGRAAQAAAIALPGALPPTVETPAGPHNLALWRGVGVGELTWEILGTPEDGLYWAAHGPALAAALAAAVGTMPPTAGASYPTRPDDAPFGAPPPQPADILPYLPPALVERVAGGRGAWIGEFRTIYPAFVLLPAAGDLQTLVARALPIISNYGGWLSAVEVGDKGRLLIIPFGAPVAHGDDAERAAGCLLALREAGVLVQAGLSGGAQYVGVLGAPEHGRCTYTALGREMNLAARLMQGAKPGQILLSEDAASSLRRRFHYIGLPPMALKGWAGEVTAAALVGRGEETLTAAPGALRGRHVEWIDLHTATAEARPGRPVLLRLVGEAGIGKSRLAAAVAADRAGEGWAVLAGTARADRQTTPYWPWRVPLARLLGLAGERLPAPATILAAAQEAVGRLVGRRLADAHLLGEVLGLPAPPGTALEPAARAGATRSLLAQLFAAAAEDGPLLIYLDDLHWADPLSWALLADLARARPPAAGPLALLVTHRPFGDLPPVYLSALPAHQAVELHELDPAAAVGLVLDRADLPVEVLARIVERGQGNPFFLEELVKAYQESGNPVLPATVQDVVQARIDRLGEAPRLTLKLASVLGRTFALDALLGSYPSEIDRSPVPQHLEELSRLDLTPLEDQNGPVYAFRHAITQEVAYNNLLSAQRRAAHERAGAWFARTAPENYPMLAYHYSRSDNLTAQRRYLQLAGESAQEVYANDAAIEYYERLLPLLPPEAQMPVLLRLGQVRDLLGQAAQAIAVYQQALDLAVQQGDLLAQAQSRLALGGVARPGGEYALRYALLEEARSGFAALGDRPGLSQALGKLGRLHWVRSELPQAELCLLEQQAIAGLIGDRRGLAHALITLGAVYDDLGEYAAARLHLENGLAIARELDARAEMERAYWGLGSVYEHQQNYAQAIEAHTQTLRIAADIGDRRGEQFSISGMGLVYLNYGDYRRALASAIYQTSTSLANGDLVGIIVGSGNLALLLGRLGHAEQAARVFPLTLKVGRALGAPSYLAVYLYYYAEFLAQAATPTRDELAAARALLAEAAELGEQTGDPEVQFKSALLTIYLKTLLGEITPPEAQAAGRELATAWPEPWQQAAIAYNIWRLDKADKQAHQAAAAAYSRLHEVQPTLFTAARFAELSGETPPPPPMLPDLPSLVMRRQMEVEEVIRRLDEYAAQEPGAA